VSKCWRCERETDREVIRLCTVANSRDVRLCGKCLNRLLNDNPHLWVEDPESAEWAAGQRLGGLMLPKGAPVHTGGWSPWGKP